MEPKKDTWHNYSLGFSNLSDDEHDLICKRFSELEKELNETGLTVESNESDSGEF